ncbi:MAG: ComEC/Rec2 family competence protein, partial [Verrucomicrobiales bacterium]
FYAYLTGLRPSAVRAAVMASIYLMGILMGRPPRLLNSLAAAALLILTFDTQQIFLPGFQLSFAVLAAIALLAPPIRRRLHHRIQPDPFIPSSLVPAATRRAVKAGRSIADLAAVSTAAWIGSAPLGLWHFHLVTPVALVANMFFVPLAFVTLSVATMSLLSAGVGLGALSILLNHLNGITAKLLLLASAGFASLPGSHFYIDPFPSRQSETCRVTVLDTGLGGAAQLISVKRPRTRILVDCGGTGSFFEVVRPFLRGEGGARLDALVLTHGDAQHLGGAAPLMSAHSPATIFQSPLRNRSPYYRDFLAAREALAPSAPPLLDVVAGDLIFEADEGDTSLRVLYPPAKTNQDFAADNQCLVLLLECHGWRVLLLSDSGFVTEKWLLENESQLRCDVMIKGRHRSDFSGLPEFLNATRPGAIVCTNFHFPQEERLEKSWVEDAENRGIQVFDQAATGAVRIDLTAGELRVESFLTDQVFTKRAR